MSTWLWQRVSRREMYWRLVVLIYKDPSMKIWKFWEWHGAFIWLGMITFICHKLFWIVLLKCILTIRYVITWNCKLKGHGHSHYDTMINVFWNIDLLDLMQLHVRDEYLHACIHFVTSNHSCLPYEKNSCSQTSFFPISYEGIHKLFLVMRKNVIIPPATKLWGVYWNRVVCPSVDAMVSGL
jgi:hypothetical protein